MLLAACVWGQQFSHRLSNHDSSDMVALGLSDDVIIAKIHSAAKPEDLALTRAPKALKAGKVSDAVIKVMINPMPVSSATTPSVVLPAPASVAPSPAAVAETPGRR